MAVEAIEISTWEDVFVSMEYLLTDLEMQLGDQNLTYHEAALLMNRLEIAVSILRSLIEFITLITLEHTDSGQNFLVLQELCDLFNQIHILWAQKALEMQRNTITLPDFGARETNRTGSAGRPSFILPRELIENVRASGFYRWGEIARMLQVSQWTVYRRAREYGPQSIGRFTDISNDELDGLLRDYISRHGNTTGESYIIGYIRCLNLKVQRDRIRESLTRVDPRNTALRWASVITQRIYSVHGPNSLWHIDGILCFTCFKKF